MAQLAADAAADGSPDAWKRATPALIATAASLQPVFRVYDAMANFKDVGVDGRGEARRAPPPPLGYTAGGDVTVRGFDALREIVTDNIGQGYLALLKFLGERVTGPDGTEVTQFHLTSAPGKLIAVNGNDVSGWFQGAGGSEHRPRVLRLADPPEQGDDVRAVQKAVMTGGRADGTYDVETALAVMRFQQSHGLNVDGIVDTATRNKLGLSPQPPAPKN
jgi:peptidoglycan hydrolase-like protein with peptidoglycan-binding domain